MRHTKKSFEAQLEELATIASKMESGTLSLSDALKNYEEGVLLARECQKMLATAEESIAQLQINEGAHDE